jgi:hypothetical protein
MNGHGGNGITTVAKPAALYNKKIYLAGKKKL